MPDDQTPPTTGNGQVTADIDAFRQQITDLQSELGKMKDLAARAQADLQNARMRGEREAVDLRMFASESILRKILPTLDNFQRAFTHMPDIKQYNEACPELVEWVKGVEAIESELMKQATEAGLKRMQSLGEVVDPQRHEVLGLGSGEDGKVVEVFEEGYELHGKVLRPAKVKAGDSSSTGSL